MVHDIGELSLMQAFQREESERHEIEDVLRSVEKKLKLPPKVSGRAGRRAPAGIDDALSDVLALDAAVPHPRVVEVGLPQDQRDNWPATTRIFSIDGVDGKWSLSCFFALSLLRQLAHVLSLAFTDNGSACCCCALL